MKYFSKESKFLNFPSNQPIKPIFNFFFCSNKNGAFSVLRTGQTPEEKGYSLRTNRLRKRPEMSQNQQRPNNCQPLPNSTLNTAILESNSENKLDSTPQVFPDTPKLTYQQLKERGFTGIVPQPLCSRKFENVKLRPTIQEFICHLILREINFGSI